MVPMTRAFAVFLVALIAFVSGCASVPMASPQEDAMVKRFQPAEGKAGIYVYRNESLGGAVVMDVFLDGQLLGRTGPKTFLYAEVEPGVHKVTGKAENESTMNIIARAGENYFIWQEVKMGVLYGRNELKTVEESAGRKGVLECKRATLEK